MRRGLALAVVLALALGACGPKPSVDPVKPPEKVAKGAADKSGDAPADKAAKVLPPAPHVYMSLQPDEAGAVSIVFAIDAGRNNTPSDDPAIRLTPENGKCNPQELRRYAFPADTARRPIFGPDEVGAGITAKDLPNFMAMAVTSEMLRRKLIDDVEESKPQNVCTRKLWERLILNQSARARG